MMKKIFVRADDLVRDSFRLARKIYDSGFKPDVLLALWRGGSPIGIVVHEFLLFHGIETYHTVVKAQSYVGIDRRKEPTVEHLEVLLEELDENCGILVVDDIFDTGCTIKKVVDELKKKAHNVKIATLFYKPGRNQTALEPDYTIHRTDEWIVFPHELIDLSRDEIREKDEEIFKLLGES